jgi:hypothetical protein
MKFSANKVSNTYQLVMVPGNNEYNHSRESPCRFYKNNRHVTLYLVRLKTSHVILNLNKCGFAYSEVFPKNVEIFSIGMFGI